MSDLCENEWNIICQKRIEHKLYMNNGMSDAVSGEPLVKLPAMF